mgnify:FL=1
MTTEVDVPVVEVAALEERRPALLVEVDIEEIRLSRRPLARLWQEAFRERVAAKRKDKSWWAGLWVADELRERLEAEGVTIEPGPDRRVVDLEEGGIDSKHLRSAGGQSSDGRAGAVRYASPKLCGGPSGCKPAAGRPETCAHPRAIVTRTGVVYYPSSPVSACTSNSRSSCRPLRTVLPKLAVTW